MSPGFFPPTRASVVEAARSADAGERRRALVGLVTGYVTARYGKGGPERNPQGRLT